MVRVLTTSQRETLKTCWTLWQASGATSFKLGLSNTNHGLSVGVADMLLDGVFWASVPTGASRSLDPASTDPTDNDLDASLCPSVSAYGSGDLGTPAALNDAC